MPTRVRAEELPNCQAENLKKDPVTAVFSDFLREVEVFPLFAMLFNLSSRNRKINGKPKAGFLS